MTEPSKKRPWLMYGAAISALCAIALGIHFRLALTPDRVIASRIRATTLGARSPKEAAELLRHSYRVMGDLGRGAVLVKNSSIPEEERSRLWVVQVLVGQYQGIPFECSVDALVLLNESGEIREVVVRRHADGV